GGLSTKNTTRLGGSDSLTDAAAVAVAVYPGLTRATRPRAVVMVDEHDWPAALAASTLSGSPLHAPLLYSDGQALPEASGVALSTMKPVGTGALGPGPAGSAERAQVIQAGSTATPAGYAVRSISGNDPASLAVAIEQAASTLRKHVPHELIVTTAQAPPAMTMPAAGLAAFTATPILFVERTKIPQATAAELQRLRSTSIYIVGPSSLVGESVARELERFGKVSRIAGTTPTGNAIAVARFADGAFGWGVVEPGHGMVFANAARPLDGPAAAPLSATGDYGPLLLLESPDAISAELGSYLSDLQPGSPPSGPVHGVYNHGWVIGDTSAVSARTQASLDARLQIEPHPATEAPLSSTTNPRSEPTPTTSAGGPTSTNPSGEPTPTTGP
ncbi:MAG TPA: hypothetical protein VNX67_07900, partial [Solirubrobacteraceae bacterium]|nr:hypothetical protein [Solirubrobacteraceae bacterium]